MVCYFFPASGLSHSFSCFLFRIFYLRFLKMNSLVWILVINNLKIKMWLLMPVMKTPPLYLFLKLNNNKNLKGCLWKQRKHKRMKIGNLVLSSPFNYLMMCLKCDRMLNSVDPNLTAPSVWSGSAVFAQTCPRILIKTVSYCISLALWLTQDLIV